MRKQGLIKGSSVRFREARLFGYVTIALATASAALPAQSALRVLRLSPSDSGTTSSLVTVMFDRPVSGVLGRAIDAKRVMSLSPSVPGIYEWRDPVTLRFVPDQPFQPGSSFNVAVDTAAAASDGKRSATPYSFSFRVRGAAPLVTIAQVEYPNAMKLGPLPTFRVLYSAPVDLDSIAAISRLEFPQNCGGTIPLRPVRQRAVARGDGYQIEYASGSSDTLESRFRRVVDLVPRDSLVPECEGMWHVASLDPARPGDSWRYKIATDKEFTVARVLPCLPAPDNNETLCDPDGLHIAFASRVPAHLLAKHVHLSPALSLPALTGTPSDLSIRERLTPRTYYTVTIDSAIRDFFGRRLKGPTTFTVQARDRAPGVRQQSGLSTIHRLAGAAPAIQVKTVNVDTLGMYIVPVPDTLIGPLLTSHDLRMLSYDMRATLRDTIRIVVPVRGQFNSEHSLSIPLPAAVTTNPAGIFQSIRFEILARTVPPDSGVAVRERRAAAVRDSIAAAIAEAVAARNDNTRPLSLSPIIINAGVRDLGLVVQTSNLLAHAKWTLDGGALFVTDIFGAPAAGATATMYNRKNEPVARGIAGSDGLATLTRLPQAPIEQALGGFYYANLALTSERYLIVTRGDDRLVLALSKYMSETLPVDVNPATLGSYWSVPSYLHGAVTSDRNIYRPGEMLYAKAYIRAGIFGALSAPAGDSVRISLSDGDKLSISETTLNVFGTATDSVRIPATFRLGFYSLMAEVKHDGHWRLVSMSDVRIAEFRAPEFLVDFKVDSAVRYLGDTVTAQLAAKYLYGAPMSGARVQWSAHVRPWESPEIRLPGTSGYSVGSSGWWDEQQRGEEIGYDGVTSLDNEGKVAIRIPTLGVLTRPVYLTIEGAVTDGNNQVVTSSQRIALHASSLYIAAKIPGSSQYWRRGESQTIDAFALRPTGERVTGVTLRVKIVRREWTADVTPGATFGVSRWVADTLQTLSVTTTLDTVPISFTPEFTGIYDVRIEATDEQGRTTITNIGRRVLSENESAVPGENPIRLRMVAGHDTTRRLSLGDTARLTFNSPFSDADAWITLEREGVMDQRVMRVAAGATIIAAPVAARYAPNVWVGVTLIRRLRDSLPGADAMASRMLTGYAELRIDSTANLLNVSVTPEMPLLAPRDTARIRVRVRNSGGVMAGAGVRSEVALWAVDEGVLSLTNFQTPDILAAIVEQIGVAPAFSTALTTLPWFNTSGAVRPGSNVRFWSGVDPASGSRAPFSGYNNQNGLLLSGMVSTDSAESAMPAILPNQVAVTLRSNFRFTAFYVGRALTDDSGNVVIRALLPDNITTFRLMATAVTGGDRYGSGASSLLVSHPVVVRPALPRFVRHGDDLVAAAIVNLRDRRSAALKVSVAASGAVIRGKTSQQLTATDTLAAHAKFGMRIPEKSSDSVASVRFTAIDALARDGDAVQSLLPIRPVGTPRAHTAIGVVRDSGTVVLALPPDVDPERSTVAIALGTSPIIAMRAHFERLRAYPYYCTEQIVTTGRALIAINRAERILGNGSAVTGDSINFTRDLQSIVDEVMRRQIYGGSFRYWSEGSFELGPWLTAYVAAFLLEAKSEGAIVASAALADTRSRLKDDLTKNLKANLDTVTGAPWERRARLRNYHGTRVVLAKVLREAGAPEIAVEDSLLASGPDMSWEDRIALAEIFAKRAGFEDRARSMLLAAWSAVNIAGKRIDFADSLRGAAPFPSHIRAAARLLTATRQLLPSHPQLGALTESIIQQGAAESLYAWNTQDYGAAIEALAAFAVTQRMPPGARLLVRNSNGRILVSRGISDARTAGDSSTSLRGLLRTGARGRKELRLSVALDIDGADTRAVGSEPALYYSITVNEISRNRPVTPDMAGIVVERWYERFDNATPVTEVLEGELVRVRLRITVPADRQFVAVEDLLPAGLEPVDLSLRTSGTLGPFVDRDAVQHAAASRQRTAGPFWQSVFYGSWDNGWWSPWEHKELRDDRVIYFARVLWTGTYNASYVARATTVGTFVRPPAHAEEMYNAALQGRSDGGLFIVRPRD